MFGQKLRRAGINQALVLGSLVVLALITVMGLTPALARSHGRHNDQNAGWAGGGGNQSNSNWMDSWGGGGSGDDEGEAFDLTSFNGRYTTAYHAFDASPTGTASEPNPPATPFAVSGTITSDGGGNITAGTLQTNFGTPGIGAASTCSESGTYTVTPDGQVILNLVSACTNVTCTLDMSGNPSCAPSGSPTTTPTQWFCTLSGPEGRQLVCTEMGEAAGGTAMQTPISAVTFTKGHAASDDGD